jgi:hypothetical protein
LTIKQFREAYDDEKLTAKGAFLDDTLERVTGRVMVIRAQGAKLIFIDLEGDRC